MIVLMVELKEKNFKNNGNLQLMYEKTLRSNSLSSVFFFFLLIEEINEIDQTKALWFYKLFINMPVNTVILWNILLGTENWLTCLCTFILYFIGNSNEIDIVHHVDTEANIATEVCLTILDLLSLFTQVHQVNMIIIFSAKWWVGR